MHLDGLYHLARNVVLWLRRRRARRMAHRVVHGHLRRPPRLITAGDILLQAKVHGWRNEPAAPAAPEQGATP